MNTGLMIILFLLVLSFLGMPIYLALGIGTLVALNSANTTMLILPQKIFAGMNSSSLLAIPFFILAGNLMSRSITTKLIDVADALIGRIKGSLAMVTVLASTLFGAISGSAVATASAIGGITINAMQDKKYPKSFSTAVAAISSILGPVIPPSIPLIVYASVVTNASVAGLFIGSLLPGIILSALMVLYCGYYGKRYDLPSSSKKTPKEIAIAFKDGIWALLMPVIILGGIFGGIFTPTEAAAVSVSYALIISFTVYKDLSFKQMCDSFYEASISTASVMIMIGLSKASSYVVVTSGLPQQLLNLFTAITSNKYIILLLINILFLIIGMLMEASAAIIMMTPILLPVLTAFNIDILHFGVMMSLNLSIGVVTPPVGLSLLVCNQIGKTSLWDTVKSMFPMFIICLLVLTLVTYIPSLTTWLPALIK